MVVSSSSNQPRGREHSDAILRLQGVADRVVPTGAPSASIRGSLPKPIRHRRPRNGLEIAPMRDEAPAPWRIDMKSVWIAVALLTTGGLSLPAHAVPPTATPSAGYDARLQETRQGSAATVYTPAPRPPKARPKKSPQQ
jgi:hypothetical protein